ncbi:MAG: hypothetical protein GIW99_03835 [Candidatus Eremiobacteraeota bacterium]|nr:hypothetical protein [Candidatus Eremiobacteraeota bacterium]MBC5826803.1 hypothetical protein [Candidatus Eremiobacteraeota bacterium]
MISSHKASLTVFLIASVLCGGAVSAGAAQLTSRVLGSPQSAAASMDGNIFKIISDIRTIGSTVDPMNGDQNPYGLDIARTSAGDLKAGDLVVCNFNDKANVQGTGTTIEVLHPTPGSNPHRLAQSPVLNGCAALALGNPGDNPWVAAYSANDNPVLSPKGQIFTPLANPIFEGPFGQAFSGTPGPFGGAAFYESNAQNGTLVRIGITPQGFTFHNIVLGFDVNHGVPGSILGPSGLTYDAARDTLYVIDGNDVGQVYAISNVTKVRPFGIQICKTSDHCFTGPDASHIRLVYSGAPLNAPISAALLFNGDLVIGNTGDNRLVQLNPTSGQIEGLLNVDNGIAGALFGIATSGTNAYDQRIYFNDDNDNTVKVVER